MREYAKHMQVICNKYMHKKYIQKKLKTFAEKMHKLCDNNLQYGFNFGKMHKYATNMQHICNTYASICKT
jgi:hypothetical protein